MLVFEKFPDAYLFQIALEIMWLPVQIKLIFHINIFPRQPYLLVVWCMKQVSVFVSIESIEMLL